MKEQVNPPVSSRQGIEKIATGIHGLDEITGGGLPKNRPTLVCGSAGSGKTVLGIEVLVNGICRFNEPGVIITFEETAQELVDNAVSFGFDLKSLMDSQKLVIRTITQKPFEIIESGSYDLSGFVVQIENAIDSVSGSRILIDGIGALFEYFSNKQTVRYELKRLFDWFKTKGVTAIVTTERGNAPSQLTRNGIEEYVSDCVILMDQRIISQICTRRLQIVKYRGTAHGTNEYPFLITDKGLSVMPVTSVGLEYKSYSERVSSGIKALDEMLDGKGYFKGSSILVSGSAGTGKSSLAANFAAAACRENRTCLYFAFEESASQIIRSMKSIGLDLQPYMDDQKLQFHAIRPTLHGIEMHLLNIYERICEFSPDTVVFDPISNLTSVGSLADSKILFLRVLDLIKKKGITALLTNLCAGGISYETTEVDISSIMDTWILLENTRKEASRERSIQIVKSRGMAHSNQILSFNITGKGVVITHRNE